MTMAEEHEEMMLEKKERRVRKEVAWSLRPQALAPPYRILTSDGSDPSSITATSGAVINTSRV